MMPSWKSLSTNRLDKTKLLSYSVIFHPSVINNKILPSKLRIDLTQKVQLFIHRPCRSSFRIHIHSCAVQRWPMPRDTSNSSQCFVASCETVRAPRLRVTLNVARWIFSYWYGSLNFSYPDTQWHVKADRRGGEMEHRRTSLNPASCIK